MKKCNCCQKIKSFDDFHKLKSSKDGLSPKCRECKAQADKKYRQKNVAKLAKRKRNYYLQNKNKIRAEQYLYYSENKDKINKQKREHYQLNKERIKTNNKNWRQANLQKSNSAKAARKAKQRSFYKNLKKDKKQEVIEMYELRMLLDLASASAGSLTRYHVDHIYPINGKKASGLHAPWNLQILTAQENMSKKNRPQTETICK